MISNMQNVQRWFIDINQILKYDTRQITTNTAFMPFIYS